MQRNIFAVANYLYMQASSPEPRTVCAPRAIRLARRATLPLGDFTLHLRGLGKIAIIRAASLEVRFFAGLR